MLKELYLLWLRLAAPQDLHYINGADTLPPPLPPEQERAALDALTRGQPQARDLLITHNLRLVVYIAKKFETPSAGIEDMISTNAGAMSSAMMNMAMNAAGGRSERGRVAVGAGWQNGESALSVGYSKQLGERASFSIGGAFSSDDSSAGIGFGLDL